MTELNVITCVRHGQMLDTRHAFDHKSQCYKALDARDYIILIPFLKLILVSMSQCRV